MKKRLLSLFAALMFTGAVFAQAPNAVNYQAVARDNSGKVLVSQSVSLRISVLSGSSSGATEYQETFKNVNTTAYGQFSIMIGNGTPVGSYSFTGINWSSNTHWLKVELDVANGTNYSLAGTSQMVSVPYALYSEKSGSSNSPWSTSGSDIYYNGSGNIGLGIANPKFPLHFVNTLSSSSLRSAYFRTYLLSSPSSGFGVGLQSSIIANYSGSGSEYNIGLDGYAGGYNNGVNVGVYGTADSSYNSNRGVLGLTSGIGGVNQGVFGRSDGSNSSSTGQNTGTIGYAINHSNQNVGVFGFSDATGTENQGVSGVSLGKGSSSTNVGVFGAAANAGTNYAGFFSGNLAYTGSLSSVSDAKFKTDVTNMSSVLPALMQLQPKSYFYKTTEFPSFNLPLSRQYGFIAQELETVFPLLVSKGFCPGTKDYSAEVAKDGKTPATAKETPGTEFKSVNYMGMIPILTQAIREQQVMIQELQKKVADLEAKTK